MKDLVKSDIPVFRTIKKVEIPEWNGAVHIRTWTGTERYKIINKMVKIKDEDDRESVYATMMEAALYSVCDATGKRMFATLEEVDELDPVIVQQLYEQIFDHNKMTEKTEKETIKNSEACQS
jgi:hypothetical protein